MHTNTATTHVRLYVQAMQHISSAAIGVVIVGGEDWELPLVYHLLDQRPKTGLPAAIMLLLGTKQQGHAAKMALKEYGGGGGKDMLPRWP
jgi:hypothetical protein